uniref:IRK_C domain-containing protein n=1 Tax=Heterorhabditis bacteriophora TaxID=37862 RepID=A0A1I7XE80_HETBA
MSSQSIFIEAGCNAKTMLALILSSSESKVQCCSMIKRCVTYEGELLPFHQFDMDVGYDQGLDRVFVIWPITICHEIDEMSPLYDISEEDLKNAKFEIIAILEGVVESVGSTTQARTSYLPSEILWGKRLARGLFDDFEYQMYPPSDNRNLAIISDDTLLTPCQESIDANQIQILRRDSDEDPDAGEDTMELTVNKKLDSHFNLFLKVEFVGMETMLEENNTPSPSKHKTSNSYKG